MGDFNPYAAPDSRTRAAAAARETGRVWRQGDRLIVDKGSVLPDRCVRCNAPADGYKLKKTLYWHPPWVYITIFAGLLIFVVAALLTRKQGDLHLGLCPKHRSLRRNLLIAAGVSPLLFIGTCFGGAEINSGALMLSGMLLTILAPLVLVVVATVARPTKIDDHFIHLKVGRPFLESYDATNDAPHP